MYEIRMPDLNIITAHWVGFDFRTNPEDAGYPMSILASKDPIELDYIASRDLLMPLIKRHATNKSYLFYMNDAENSIGQYYKFPQACHEAGFWNISPARIRVHKI